MHQKTLKRKLQALKMSCYEAEEKESDLDLCSQTNITLENNSSSNADKLDEFQKNKILDRKNYLRQNLMVPLTWALNKTLKYNPTNPIHYIACQLLRWKYNNINPKEKEETINFVIDATIKRDLKLLEKKLQREGKDTDKSKHVSYQQCHCKNIRELSPKICQFPAFCSSCQVSEFAESVIS